MRITWLWVGLVMLFHAESAFAMRCGTHLVREGDSRGRVLQLCGEPTDVSQRVEEQSVRQAVPAVSLVRTSDGTAPLPAPQAGPVTVLSASRAILIESWTFNFGPDRAMQRVVFYDGVVHHIEALGRGYLEDTQGNLSRSVRTGETRDRVRATWGEPTETSSSVIERAATTRLAAPGQAQLTQAPNIAQGVRVRVLVEVWTYNLGPNRHMRRVTFEDGRVVSVESLGPGY